MCSLAQSRCVVISGAVHLRERAARGSSSSNGARTNWDLAIEKRQRVRHGTLIARAEVLNAFNHVDFIGPIIQWGRSDFGQILSEGGFPRTLQLMLRWQF